MKARLLVLALVLGSIAGVLTAQFTGPGSPAGDRADPSMSTVEADAPDAGVAVADSETLVRDVVVRDMDGRIAWRGDVDLSPALARIEAGESDPHRNDGGLFGNRERLLPVHEYGYYREYVVRTPGLPHAGPQRLVIGQGGEVYYTSDHYASFVRIR